MDVTDASLMQLYSVVLVTLSVCILDPGGQKFNIRTSIFEKYAHAAAMCNVKVL